MVGVRFRKARKGACLVVGAALAGCHLVLPPVTPNPDLVGCYRLETNLPESYADSLGYELPDVIQLGHSSHGDWTVVPTDPDWPPTWTTHDALPSGYVARRIRRRSAPIMKSDSVSRIPGDSIDVRFPGPLGSLTLRLGPGAGGELRGRTEWVVRIDQYFTNEGVFVRATPSSCDDVQLALRRVR